MKHRDGSATFVPNEGTYIPRGGRDKNTNIPAPTMEEITKEHEQIKEEYRQYLVRPVKYWNGVCQTRYHDISWFFPKYFPCFLWTIRLLTRPLQLWLR